MLTRLETKMSTIANLPIDVIHHETVTISQIKLMDRTDYQVRLSYSINTNDWDISERKWKFSDNWCVQLRRYFNGISVVLDQTDNCNDPNRDGYQLINEVWTLSIRADQLSSFNRWVDSQPRLMLTKKEPMVKPGIRSRLRSIGRIGGWVAA